MSGGWVGKNQQQCQENVKRSEVSQRDCGGQSEVQLSWILQLKPCYHQEHDMCWFKPRRYLSGKSHHSVPFWLPPSGGEVTFSFPAGGLRRAAAVQRRAGRNHFLWAEVWCQQPPWSLFFSHRKTTQLDQQEYRVLWHIISRSLIYWITQICCFLKICSYSSFICAYYFY